MSWYKRRDDDDAHSDPSPNPGRDGYSDWYFSAHDQGAGEEEVRASSEANDGFPLSLLQQRIQPDFTAADSVADTVADSVADTADYTRGDATDRPASASAAAALTAAFRGPAAVTRVAAVARDLDLALTRWWSDGLLPPLALLRDGLLALEAGHALDESRRTLLLRSALAYDRGALTALAHQSDPERTGLLIAAALLEPNAAGAPPLSLARIQTLVWDDPAGPLWLPYLKAEIDARHLIAGPADPGSGVNADCRTLAQQVQALTVTRGRSLHNSPSVVSSASPAVASDLAGERPPTLFTSRNWVRLTLILLAALLLGAMLFGRQLRVRARDTVTVPAAAHTLVDEANASRTVALDTFVIDRREVTVGAFRRCYGAGACPWPATSAGLTLPDYLTNRVYNQFPMVNVDWFAADAYCQWAGMRLPTVDEWQVAASFAPATNRYYRYPWGDTPELQLANSAATGQGEPQATGLYHPAGSSPMGMADAAGNVAEWTATFAGAGAYWIKGGSFQDDPVNLTATWAQARPAEAAAPWLGFRCAASPQ